MFRKFFLNRKSKNLFFYANRRENLEIKSENDYKVSKKIIIPLCLVGKRIKYHNGLVDFSLKITHKMVGYKLSEFFFKRKRVVFNKVKKR